MRIVSGIHKGRALQTPKDNAIRPTTDRVREAIFNVLTHSGDGFDFAGVRVLDLFAGTGALGLEALSRGAKFTLFIEENAAARGLIRTNAETLGATGTSKIWRRDASRLSQREGIPGFDLVFADPPYNKGLGNGALSSLVAGDWLNPGAMIVVEEAKTAMLEWPAQLSLTTQKNYGDSTIYFLKLEVGAC